MSDFNYETDKVEIRGFIDMNKILEYVTDEDIFQLVFGYKPVEYEYTTSPFRGDSTPGCWFERDERGVLRFWDFGNTDTYKHIRLKNLNCFDAVFVYYQLRNFYETLNFIYYKLIKGKSIKKLPKKTICLNPNVKLGVEILTSARMFYQKDGHFWSKYHISSDNLIEDRVFAIKKFTLLNTRKGKIVGRPDDICYAFTEFLGGRKKLYFPNRKGRGRFITNCISNDIGGLKVLKDYGDKLVITKSYKDWRVLKNLGLEVIWFQSEGITPDLEILLNIIRRFNETILWFDNDSAGIQAMLKIYDTIEKHLPNRLRTYSLPNRLLIEKGIKDPADLIFIEGEKELRKITNANI